ncbi:hypothetical protein B0H14DRAFT_2568062 [Mycena olivaceomarginata]|nr:hypothetical protein B0H14DRAFT_2568062 [Mycena olivaceomarginata]
MRAGRNGRAAGMDGLPRGETGRRRERMEVRREKDGRDAGGMGERRGWTGLRRGKYIERGAGRNGKEAGMDGTMARTDYGESEDEIGPEKGGSEMDGDTVVQPSRSDSLHPIQTDPSINLKRML